MNTVIKRALSALLFLLVLAACLNLAGRVVVPKDNTTEAGIREEDAYGILGEPDNTIEVLVIGDSLAKCSVSPIEIWREQGITSTDCSVGNLPLTSAVEFLNMVLEHQSPKILLLETNTIYSTIPITDKIANAAEVLFPVIRFHDRWKSLTLRDWTQAPHYTHTDIGKGCHISLDVFPSDELDYMEYSDYVEPFPRGNGSYVKKMRDICQRNGIQLVLYSAPSTSNWCYGQHNGIQQLADELGLTYMDLNLCTDEIGIDWNLDTMDNGNHLNTVGCAKSSSYIGQYLARTGLFTDKRSDPAYANWNTAVEKFDAHIAKLIAETESAE